jgi:hypothetical protein
MFVVLVPRPSHVLYGCQTKMGLASDVSQETVFEAGDRCALTSVLILASISDFPSFRITSWLNQIVNAVTGA